MAVRYEKNHCFQGWMLFVHKSGSVQVSK